MADDDVIQYTNVFLADDDVSAWCHAVNAFVTMSTPSTSPLRRRAAGTTSKHTDTHSKK